MRVSVQDILGILGLFGTLFGGRKVKTVLTEVAHLMNSYETIKEFRANVKIAKLNGSALSLDHDAVTSLDAFFDNTDLAAAAIKAKIKK